VNRTEKVQYLPGATTRGSTQLDVATKSAALAPLTLTDCSVTGVNNVLRKLIVLAALVSVTTWLPKASDVLLRLWAAAGVAKIATRQAMASRRTVINLYKTTTMAELVANLMIGRLTSSTGGMKTVQD
jgi:hypothetical protein